MRIEPCIKAVLNGKELDLSDGEFPCYITTRYISFVSPAFAKILNLFNNNELMDVLSNESKLKCLQITVPPIDIDTFKLFNKYAKKGDSVKTKKEEDKINWVSKVFAVTRKEAEEYLRVEEFNKAVTDTMFR